MSESLPPDMEPAGDGEERRDDGAAWPNRLESGAPYRSPSTVWDPHLTHRLRVLLHARPLLDLQRHLSHYKQYDLLTLALKLFDLLIETTGLEQELDSAAAIRALIPLLIQMDQYADIEPERERHMEVAEHLLRAVRNEEEARRPFRFKYIDFDATGAVPRMLEVRLVREYFHPDGRIVLRLTNEAINLFLNALKLDIEDAQAAAEAVVQSQLDRGRFDDAVNSARDARLQSIRFQEKIDWVLHETRRDLSRVNWQEEVPGLLSGALTHIELRCRVEEHIMTSAREKLQHLPLGSPEAERVAQVIKLVEECCQRHVDLHAQLMRARKVFLDEQERQSFAPKRVTIFPHPIAGILEPLLQARQPDAVQVVERVFPVFFGARAPAAFSLAHLLTQQLRPPRDARPEQTPLQQRDLLSVDQEHVRYSPESHRQVVAALTEVRAPTRLSELLAHMGTNGASMPTMELLALMTLRLFGSDATTTQLVRVEKLVEAPLSVAGFAGDDLLITEGGVHE